MNGEVWAPWGGELLSGPAAHYYYHHHLETEINKYQHSGPGAAFKLHFMYSNPVLSVWGTVVESVLAPHRSIWTEER